jgi:hypothetical protein
VIGWVAGVGDVGDVGGVAEVASSIHINSTVLFFLSYVHLFIFASFPPSSYHPTILSYLNI